MKIGPNRDAVTARGSISPCLPPSLPPRPRRECQIWGPVDPLPLNGLLQGTSTGFRHVNENAQ